MHQHHAVIRTMEQVGGEATLGYLYQNALKVEGVKWGTKTPYASIRRIVQDPRFFFKIRPGLWALKSHEKAVREKYGVGKAAKKSEPAVHALYQGLLLELGNLKGFQTFVPAQDKNKRYLNRKLGEVATIGTFFPIGYDRFTQKARTVDVTWFNDRNMPESWFEVEHSTDIQNSLVKFSELQDFSADLHIVADAGRRRDFESKLGLTVFRPIRERVSFWSYDKVSQAYEYSLKLASL